MTASKSVTVLIVDDHPVVRDGLNAILSTESDLTVVGEAASGKEALQIIPALRPDIVVMDLFMPGMNGAEVIQALSGSMPDTDFIVLTTAAGDQEIVRALEAGARGYLFKDTARKDLIQAIRAVHRGERYIPTEVGSRMAEYAPRNGLSAREVEVLQAIASGHRNKQIAESLGVAETTVVTHLKHIFEKLHVTDRTHAVTTALRRGIIRL